MMEQNVGLTDRYLRISLGSLMLAAGAARMVRSVDTTAVLLGLAGGMTLADGVLGTCPYYSMVGISTRAGAMADGSLAEQMMADDEVYTTT